MRLMSSAFATLNYDLSYIQVYEGLIEPRRLSHGIVDGVEVSYLSFLNGPPREYVQRGELVSFFEPEVEPYTLQTRIKQGSIFNLVHQDLARLQQSYEFVLAGKSRVAGRLAQVIRMSSIDNDRYSYLIWLDKNTHIPLRLDTLDQRGMLAEQMMAVSLRMYNEPTPWITELTSMNLPALVKVAPPSESDNQLQKWQAAWLPAGFELVVQDRHNLPLNNDTVDYLMLSDGLAFVSIYVERAPVKYKQPTAKKGATNLVSTWADGYNVTVIGDIPSETALKIARSLKPERL